MLAPVMSRFLDGRPDRSPDITHGLAVPGDRFLLCSDGLSGVVPEDAIRSALGAADELAKIIESLIALAIDAGGPDNITAVVIDVLSSPACAGSVQVLGAAAQAEGSSQGGNLG